MKYKVKRHPVRIAEIKNIEWINVIKQNNNLESD